MKFLLKTLELKNLTTDCVIIGIYENGSLTEAALALDKLSHGYVKTLLKQGEFQGKLGQTFLAYLVPHIKAKRVLLVGLGKNTSDNPRDYRKIIAASMRALTSSQSKEAVSFLIEMNLKNRTVPWKIKQAVESTEEARYTFDQFKTTKEPKSVLKTLTFSLPKNAPKKECELALRQALAVARGIEFTKNLANLPSNICTPTYLTAEAKKLAARYKGVTVKILDQARMKKLGMNAFLAVAKGSAEAAKLICLEYKGAKKSAPVALIGKGITFDTGGISLKPSDNMVGMKYDMCGAATVLGVLHATAELKLPVNLVGILATAENMPSGTACKPEDIVTSLSGQTIEIMNTDAEGRLVLSDALTYAERYKPEVVIDIATLTGAVVIALGVHATGLLSNYEPLAKDLLDAGIESYDRAWQLPLWDEYQDQLKSPFADMSNVGGRAGGTITAACFLSRFAKKFHWAHLDVAGTAAQMGGTDRYATGRPVPMLMQYLITRCEKNAKN